MNFNYKFKKDVDDIIIPITGKRYSDTGMMWQQLSNIIKIDMDTLSMYDDWYILDDGFYYYKSNFIFEELFMSELAKVCGVRCVDFKLAIDHNTYKSSKMGVISKLYREDNKEYYYYSEFCKKFLGGYFNDFNKFNESISMLFDDYKTSMLMSDIFGIICFDMFTGQYDRGEHNFMFEYDYDNIRIAPLCDNGLSFHYGFNYESPFGRFCLLEGDMYCSFKYNLLNLIRNNNDLYDRFEYILNVDINEVLKRTLDKYKIIMSFGNRNKLLSYFDFKKRVIDGTLRLSKK